MGKVMSEKRVLKKLGIDNFRHMTKDKIIKFASMLPYMDTEVAKKALEQFPSFKELASEMVVQYKEVLEKTISGNENSQQSFYDACNSIISSLQRELEDDEIDSSERNRIEDKMIEVAQMIGDKDTENKGFLLKLAAIGVGGLLAIIGITASILGGNSQASNGDGEDDIAVE